MLSTISSATAHPPMRARMPSRQYRNTIVTLLSNFSTFAVLVIPEPCNQLMETIVAKLIAWFGYDKNSEGAEI